MWQFYVAFENLTSEFTCFFFLSSVQVTRPQPLSLRRSTKSILCTTRPECHGVVWDYRRAVVSMVTTASLNSQGITMSAPTSGPAPPATSTGQMFISLSVRDNKPSVKHDFLSVNPHSLTPAQLREDKMILALFLPNESCNNYVANESLKAITFIHLSYYCGHLFFKDRRFTHLYYYVHWIMLFCNCRVQKYTSTTCTSKRGCPAITDMLVLELNEWRKMNDIVKIPSFQPYRNPPQKICLCDQPGSTYLTWHTASLYNLPART